MAIYRQLHTTFWKDDFIGECSQIEKLFYLYLISNDKTTQSGAYEFSYRYAQFELGISKEEVDRLLDFFVSKGKIRFNKQHNEVLLINWLKYNSAKSPKVAPVIDKELDNLKTVEFKSEVVMNCMKLDYPIKTKLEDLCPIDMVSESEIYHIDTISQPEPTQNHHQHITNSSSKKEMLKDSATTSGISPFEFYQQNFGVLAPVVSESINYWVKDIGVELVIEAMSRAVKEHKGFRYSEGIMKNWAKKNILSMEAVKADDVAFQNRQKSDTKSLMRKETLPDWALDNNHEQLATPLPPEEEAEMKKMIERLKKPK